MGARRSSSNAERSRTVGVREATEGGSHFIATGPRSAVSVVDKWEVAVGWRLLEAAVTFCSTKLAKERIAYTWCR